MMERSSISRRTPIVASVLCLIAVSVPQSARAGDKEFGTLVHYVESHYHAHRSYRFLLGFASLAVNVARPYGVKGMKLALWENQNISAKSKDDSDFPAVVRAGLADGWQPLVQVWSHRDGERTVIFAKPDGKNMKLLVATVESDEAVVVQMKIDPDRLSECIDHWSKKDPHENHGNKNDTRPAAPNGVSPEPMGAVDTM